MRFSSARVTWAGLLVAGLCLPASALGADEPPASEIAVQETPAEPRPQSAPEEREEPRDPLALLLAEIDALQQEIETLRRELAEARLAAAESERELEELRQFVQDHRELGRDFEQYTSIKAIAEREARRRRVEEMRRQREADRVERAERLRNGRSQRAGEEAEAQRRQLYRQAGFTSVGLDVYVGQMAYFYQAEDKVPFRFDYELGLGHYLRFYRPHREIDFSSMTISGTALNAAETVRNIGIAVTFFDEGGNQVGGEIVQINNARPDVPYPFTATLEMALDRPFSSSSTYVLYADEAGQADGEEGTEGLRD
ncbi:MAG: hypothetical protein ACYS0G_07595 [Planctomycetota bacterium]|jgi:hypothetical protein